MRGEWIRCHRPRPDAEFQLLCIPHAGGTPGLYRPWGALLPERVELLLACLPGREVRLGEPFPASMPVLVADLAEAAMAVVDRPWAIFGHSMGAVVGHELALRLRSLGKPAPRHLIVSARKAPQDHLGGTIHLRDEDELCAELIRLGGTHPELLEASDVRELILPAVRNDYRLIETYEARPDGVLDCPITVFVGRDDPELTVKEAVGWQRWTDGAFEVKAFPGGHFYLADRPGEVVSTILAQVLPGL